MSNRFLLIDGSRGIYIPQTFAKNFNLEVWHVDHLTEDIEILLAGPEHEHYWDAWDSIVDSAYYVDPKTQTKYYLEPDGDLFANNYEETDDETR